MSPKNLAVYALMVLIVAVASTNLYTFILQQRDPITYQKVWTDTPEVKLNSVFRAHYALTRLRPCRTEVSTFMENTETHEIVRRETYIGGARAPGVYEDILLAFKVPPPANTGCYTLGTTATNYCSEGVHVIQAPYIKFCVVE